MGMEESDITNKIRLKASELGVTLFKNVRGFFWTLDKKRKIRAGLMCDGASDLIGYKSIKITQEMVGERISVFVALEIKTPLGHASEEQKDFIARVKERGGIAGIARSSEDAEKILK